MIHRGQIRGGALPQNRWTGPLARNYLAASFAIPTVDQFNAATGKPGVWTNPANFTIANTPYGPALNNSTPNTSEHILFAGQAAPGTQTRMTGAAVVRLTSTVGTRYIALFGGRWAMISSAGTFAIESPNLNAAQALTVNRDYFVAFTHDLGTGYMVVRDLLSNELRVGTISGGVAPVPNSANILVSNVAASWPGQIGMCWYSTTVVPLQLLLQWSLDPWAPFRTERKWYVRAAEAAGVTTRSYRLPVLGVS